MTAQPSSRTSTAQRLVEMSRQCFRTSLFRGRQCSHDNTRTRREVGDSFPHQMPQLALDSITIDRISNCLAHDETDGRVSAGSRNDMSNEGWLGSPGPTTNRVPEVLPAAHALTAREQGIRRRAWRDPCGDGPRGSHGRRGCAYGGGSHASWHDDGYSAGRCACSRCCPFVCTNLAIRMKNGPVDGHRSPTTDAFMSWARGGSRSVTTNQRYVGARRGSN